MIDGYDLDGEEQDIKDIDFSEGELDLNWFSKLNADKSKIISENGETLGRFDDTGSTWWNVIKYESTYYVSLNDLEDIFEVNKSILERI